MKLLHKSHDGGKDSGVTGYWLIEWKSVFSIVLLKFKPNHRENYHSHAFNAVTWWLWGEATEQFVEGNKITWKPSILPKITMKNNIHRYSVKKTAIALSFRGPWNKTWKEYAPGSFEWITLSKGRTVLHKLKIKE